MSNIKIKNLFKLILLFGFIITNNLFANDSKQVIIATTTSVENSGLLNYLLKIFEKNHNIRIKVIATGTGRALKLAEKGDVDMIMVHAPKKEIQFIKNGFGVERKSFMYNYFLIVGPKKDPAKIKNSNSALRAFLNIQNNQTLFISRGDNSGTYFKELSIWQKLKFMPKRSWYLEVGQGMGKTLQIADELNAYTLVDQGTWLKLKDKLQLKLLYYGDSLMLNLYSVILVNPNQHPNIDFKSAKIFADWLTSKHTKAIINNYKISGQQLFFANNNN